MQTKHREEFITDFRKWQRFTIAILSFSMFSFVGLLIAQIPLSSVYQHFFRIKIGGMLGEGFLGISVPLLASPPVYLALTLILKRARQNGLQCISCQYLFASQKDFDAVITTNRCPECATDQFFKRQDNYE